MEFKHKSALLTRPLALEYCRMNLCGWHFGGAGHAIEVCRKLSAKGDLLV